MIINKFNYGEPIQLNGFIQNRMKRLYLIQENVSEKTAHGTITTILQKIKCQLSPSICLFRLFYQSYLYRVGPDDNVWVNLWVMLKIDVHTGSLVSLANLLLYLKSLIFFIYILISEVICRMWITIKKGLCCVYVERTSWRMNM